MHLVEDSEMRVMIKERITVNPMASMQVVENEELKEIAIQVRDLLEKVIKNV